MQISDVRSRFCLALTSVALSAVASIAALPLTACAAGTSSGLPDDIMTESKPPAATPAPSKVAPKKETERVEKASAAPPKKDSAKKPAAKAASGDDAAVKKLRDVDTRYQTAKSVAMDVERNLIMGLLGKEKKAKGTLLLSKGRMRMELTEPEKSLVVIDGKTLWVADYPSADFKGAAVQVLRGKISSKKGANQGFVGLLTRGGVLSQFKVTGTQVDESGRTLYFLQPKQATAEFKRAQLVLSTDSKSIQELRYWDERDNETKLTFSNVKFDGKVEANAFSFTPPENSDITTL